MTEQPENYTECYLKARALAENLAARWYPDVPQWRPLPDLCGVLDQIDNMTTGATRTPPEPATDAELVELAAKTFVAEYWEGNPTWERLPPEARTNLKLDMSAVIAAIAPAIRSQERAKIVAWLRAGALYRDWKRASLRLRIKAAWLSFRRPWTFAKSACETQLATAIEQGTHDNETE